MSDTRKRCFVISPIGAAGSQDRRHADAVLEFIVSEATQRFEQETGIEIEVVRSDRILESGSIEKRMYQEIFRADLCVAVLTGFNPNVFYELAVAQCAARPVILLIEKGNKPPFDVQDLRCIEYGVEDICQLVAGRYAEQVVKRLKTIHAQGWIAKSLFEEHGYAEQQRLEQQLRGMVHEARPKPLEAGIDAVYHLPGDDRRHLALVTGDIVKLPVLMKAIKDNRHPPVDVVVSLEDVNLQLARYFEASIPGAISGTLRYLDAKKSQAKIRRDSLCQSLRKALHREGISIPAARGTVIPTPTTQLKRDLGIRYVFHVAAMDGALGDGYRMMDDLIDDCVRNVFRRFNRLARGRRLKTLLFPLLGAAATQLEPVEVARRLLRPIVRQMKLTGRCRTTYVLAWLEIHRLAVRQAAAELVERGELVDESATAEIRAAA